MISRQKVERRRRAIVRTFQAGFIDYIGISGNSMAQFIDSDGREQLNYLAVVSGTSAGALKTLRTAAANERSILKLGSYQRLTANPPPSMATAQSNKRLACDRIVIECKICSKPVSLRC